MEQLYTRDGAEYGATPEINESGKPVRRVPVACDRCHVVNGQRVWLMGMENGRPYSRTGFECWTCGNTGIRGERVERLFTAAQLARANKSAATRAATREAKRVAAEQQAAAERAAKEVAFRANNADFLAKLETLDGDYWDGFRESFLQRATAPTARQIELVEGEVAKRIANASSAFLGAVGDKITLTITVERVIVLESQFYGTNYVTIARTAEGNVVTYKGRTDIGAKGDALTIKASIKEHVLYKGVQQTVIQRPKLVA